MSLSHETRYSDDQLVQYLLRLLPEEDVEQIDELSIIDEEMAWRLRVVEDDLVDAYVKGNLSGERRSRFDALFLSTERGRRKVQFARNFLRQIDREARPKTVRASWSRPPRSMAGWSLAAAAALLLVCGGLVVRDVQLRDVLSQAQRQRAALEQRARELEQQLNDQRAANVETIRELERVRAAMAEMQAASVRLPDRPTSPSPSLGVIAILLLPQTRAVGQIPTLTVPQGTSHVTFELQLESNRLSRYQAVVKDPASNASVWRSGRLTVMSRNDRPAVSVAVPASVLKAQHYSIELTGDNADVVGTYAVRIALP
jgi:hypothetical protein